MALSTKTAQEIGWMLDDYGIKHGPVVDSTRSLYEKKLRDAMAKDRSSRSPSRRALHRQPEENVTYIHHRQPLRQERFADKWRTSAVLPSEYEELDAVAEPVVYRTQKFDARRQSSSGSRSGTRVPLWMQVLLFLMVLGILVFIFIHMEPAATEPFRRLT